MIFQKYKNIREWWYRKYSSDYQIDDFYDYCKNGNVEGAFVAIKKGFDPNLQNTADNNCSGMMYASANDKHKIVEYLLKCW